MIAPTHMTFAELFYLLILTAMGVPLGLSNAVVIALASVLPDIDTPASSVGRLAPAISSRLERWYGHRTITHSVVGMTAVAAAALPVLALSRELYVCFVAGYVSHPLLDTMTVTGVKLLHPFSPMRCVFPFDGANPRRYRVTTGSTADKALAALFAAACLPMFLIAHQGYERVIRLAQGSIDAAVRDYNEFAGSHLVVADIEASDALTRSPLRGKFALVGALDGQTLLFRGPDGGLHTLGKAFQAEFVADNVVCARARPVRWEARTIDAGGRMVAQIRQEVEPAEEGYLFGSLALDEDAALPADARVFQPVTARGNLLTLRYATADDLDRLGLDDRVVLKGILTVKARYAGGGGLPGGARADRFAHIAFASADSMELLARVGDTLRPGRLIARRAGARSIAERISLNRGTIALLATRRADAEVEGQRSVAVAESVLAEHAAELASAGALAESGYVPQAALAPFAVKARKAEASLAALRAALERAREALELQVRRLEVRNAELEAQRARMEDRSAIRSTVAGVVTNVRSRLVAGNTQVTVVVRRALGGP